MNQKTFNPHRERRTAIHTILLAILAIAIALTLWGCGGSKHGCRSTRGMSGYSYIKNVKTGLVCVFNPQGKLICMYNENDI
jgi:hypothetical protein